MVEGANVASCRQRPSIALLVAVALVSDDVVGAGRSASGAEVGVRELRAADQVDIGDIRYSLGNVTPDPALESAILDQLDGYESCEGDPGGGVRYFYDAVDLNDDGVTETMVYLFGGDVCGTGGCTALIFRSEGQTHALMTRLTLVSNPIVVSDRTTNGWHDLVLYVSGGGAEPAYHVLQHAGTGYPQNPSVAPTLEAGTVVDGDAYIANEISFDTPAPVLRSPGCVEAGLDLLHEESIGDLRVDLAGEQVVELLGDPQIGAEPVMSEVDSLFHQVWRYPGDGIILDMISEVADGAQVIGAVQVGAPSALRTRRGMGIGNSYAEVEEAYAAERDEEGSDPPSTFVAGSVHGGLLFWFDGEQKLERMLLGAAAE